MTDRPRAPHGPSDCAGPLDVSRGRLKPEIDADMVDPVWRMLNWSAPGVVLVASLIAPGPEPRRDDRTVAPDSAAVASAKIAVTSQPWLQPKAILTNATSVGFRRTDFH